MPPLARCTRQLIMGRHTHMGLSLLETPGSPKSGFRDQVLRCITLLLIALGLCPQEPAPCHHGRHACGSRAALRLALAAYLDARAGVMTGSLRPSIPADCDPEWASIMQVGGSWGGGGGGGGGPPRAHACATQCPGD